MHDAILTALKPLKFRSECCLTNSYFLPEVLEKLYLSGSKPQTLPKNYKRCDIQLISKTAALIAIT